MIPLDGAPKRGEHLPVLIGLRWAVDIAQKIVERYLPAGESADGDRDIPLRPVVVAAHF